MDKYKHLTTPLLLIAVVLIALPLAELAVAAWPMAPNDAGWRVAAVGLLSSAVLHPLIGSLIVLAVAMQGEMTWLLRTISVLNGLDALLLVVALPVFVLDSLDLTSGVPDEARLGIDVATVRVSLVIGLALVVLVGLAWAGLKASLSGRRHKEHWSTKRSPVISLPDK